MKLPILHAFTIIFSLATHLFQSLLPNVSYYVQPLILRQDLNVDFLVSERGGAQNNSWQNRVDKPVFDLEWVSADRPKPITYNLYWGTDPHGISAQSQSSYVFSPEKVTAGAFYLRVSTNTDVWQTIFIFLFDDIPPTLMTSVVEKHGVQNSSVCQSSINQPEFEWSGTTDSLSGIDLYEYYFGNNIDSSRRSGWTREQSFKTNPLKYGSYILSIRTKDKAGNYSAWGTYLLFRYDRCFNPSTPPLSYWFTSLFIIFFIFALSPNFIKKNGVPRIKNIDKT